MKEEQLALRKLKAQKRCLYDWNSTIVIEITAGLSLLFFFLARNDAAGDWQYIFCFAAVIAVMVIAICAKYLPMIIRGIPILLYAVFYIAGACLSFGRAQAVERHMMPAIILNGFRLAAGIAMIILVLALQREKEHPYACYCWRMIGSACMVGMITDVFRFIIAFLTLDIDALGGVGLYELTIRMLGEFWFAVAALIAIRPQYVTINYRKVNGLLWDYLGLLPWIALIIAAIILLVMKETVNFRFLVWCVALLDMEITAAKWVHRKMKADEKLSHEVSKNYIKTFCSRAWFYSYYDVVDILAIQQKLESIKVEQEFLEMGPFTNFTMERLDTLDGEEWDLLMSLELRYAIPMRFPVEPQS